jgi:DNA-directed RNA polymerase specialized sigma24 family protein
MTSAAAEVDDHNRPATARFEAIYDKHASLLLAIIVDKFAIAAIDAQTLVHEAFLSFFMNMDDVRDVRAWLVGAVCNASRTFLKKRDRQVSVTDEHLETPDPRNLRESLPDELAGKQALSCLTARCQLAL